jgi:hypothetical protein
MNADPKGTSRRSGVPIPLTIGPGEHDARSYIGAIAILGTVAEEYRGVLAMTTVVPKKQQSLCAPNAFESRTPSPFVALCQHSRVSYKNFGEN